MARSYLSKVLLRSSVVILTILRNMPSGLGLEGTQGTKFKEVLTLRFATHPGLIGPVQGGPGTGSTSLLWSLIRNTESQPSSRPTESE